jgi:branched-chain amino acid aminotransferase
MQAKANVNGFITPPNEAKISILDRGFQYGDSIYEVTRTYEGVPFYLEEHFDRLENSARLAKMQISQSRSFLTEEIKKTVLATGISKGEDVFIRYTISRGEGPLDLDPSTAKKTSYIILAKEIPPWKKEFYERGMVLAVPKIARNSPLALDPNIKSGNYLNNILAVAEAKEVGADDCLMLSLDGKLTESSNSNVIFVFGKSVKSPLHEPKSNTGNLKGITKTLIANLCESSGFSYSEEALTEKELSAATECFVSSATREIMPVCEIKSSLGSKSFPFGGGAVTKTLQTAYKKYVADYVQKNRSSAWF